MDPPEDATKKRRASCKSKPPINQPLTKKSKPIPATEAQVTALTQRMKKTFEKHVTPGSSSLQTVNQASIPAQSSPQQSIGCFNENGILLRMHERLVNY